MKNEAIEFGNLKIVRNYNQSSGYCVGHNLRVFVDDVEQHDVTDIIIYINCKDAIKYDIRRLSKFAVE